MPRDRVHDDGFPWPAGFFRCSFESSCTFGPLFLPSGDSADGVRVD
ncbi:hypothetical protein AB0O67_00750 [Streptomyces sp. NPDC086077]